MKSKDSFLSGPDDTTEPHGELGLPVRRTTSYDREDIGTPSKAPQSHGLRQAHKRKDSDISSNLFTSGTDSDHASCHYLLYTPLRITFAVLLIIITVYYCIRYDARGILFSFSDTDSDPSHTPFTLPPSTSPIPPTSTSLINYQLEDKIRRENYRQEMTLRKANAADFLEQYRCNPNDAKKIHLPLTLYPHATCMDGSRPAYYHRPGSGSGQYKWVIFFEGGGWCYTLEACRQRAVTDLGSSLSYPEVIIPLPHLYLYPYLIFTFAITFI